MCSITFILYPVDGKEPYIFGRPSSVTPFGRATFPQGKARGFLSSLFPEPKDAYLFGKKRGNGYILAFPWGKVASELARMTDEGPQRTCCFVKFIERIRYYKRLSKTSIVDTIPQKITAVLLTGGGRHAIITNEKPSRRGNVIKLTKRKGSPSGRAPAEGG